MPTKKFIVAVSTNDRDSYLLNAGDVQTRLVDAVGWCDEIVVDGVSDYVKPGEVFKGKINTIKHLRSIIDGIALIDAKAMTDAAISMGSFQMFRVKVTFDATHDRFTVDDERPDY